MKAGRVHREFRARDGRAVVLRALRWDDLDDCVTLINGLVGEKDDHSDLGILADTKKTQAEESEWLAKNLMGIEAGGIISVAAEVEGHIVGNSEVTRGSFSDTKLHGVLGIAISKKFRGLGIGQEMMKTLVMESREAGLKTVQLEVFANNPGAAHVYEKAGFKVVGRIPKKIHRGDSFYDCLIMAIEL